MSIVSLFSGCGGTDLGFKQAGFNILRGFDIDGKCQPTYEANIGAPLRIMNVCNINETTLQNLHIDGIIWSAPCIYASKAKGKKRDLDQEMILIREGMRIVNLVQPQFWFMENVPDIRTQFEAEFPEAFITILNTINFGVAQNRARLYASNFPFPSFDMMPLKVVKDVINYNHPNYNRPNMESLNFDIEKTLAKIHRGFGMQKRRIIDPYQPAPTVTDMHGDSFLIKKQDGNYYICTVRDHARLQGFPETFIFYGSKTHSFKEIGNAVSPVIAFHIAQAIKKQL
jgi:DNA (cytosine-5)-methyltransferase 1